MSFGETVAAVMVGCFFHQIIQRVVAIMMYTSFGWKPWPAGLTEKNENQ